MPFIALKDNDSNHGVTLNIDEISLICQARLADGNIGTKVVMKMKNSEGIHYSFNFRDHSVEEITSLIHEALLAEKTDKRSSSQQDLISGKVELHSRELIEQARYHYENNQVSKLGLDDKAAYVGGFGDGYYFLKKKLREANEQQQS